MTLTDEQKVFYQEMENTFNTPGSSPVRTAR
jgi:hypothetical protein